MKFTMGRPMIDMTGLRFGRIVVQSHAGTRSSAAHWQCLCDCGQVFIASGGNIRSGRQASCGCRNAEARSERKGRRYAQAPTYAGAHARVYASKGKASSQRCASCGSGAEQWAYDHADPNELVTKWNDQQGFPREIAYSPDPTHYLALCKPCHWRFDNDKIR